MKNLVTTLTIFQLLITPVFSQELPGCYLINETGDLIKLTKLCPNEETPLTENTETPKTNETPTTETPPPVSPPENSPAPTPNNTSSPNNNGSQNMEKNGQNQVNFFAVSIKDRLGGIPLIDVTFNGGKTFEMLLDTGATITTITPTMMSELNVIPVQNVPVKTAAGVMESKMGKVNSIKVGNLEMNNLSVVLAPSLSFGLLGQNFYHNYDVHIKENSVEFYPRNKL